MVVRWSGPLAPYGKLTGDRRQFTPGTIDQRNGPLPLSYQASSTPGGHAGSVVVGSIDGIDLNSNPIQAHGRFLSANDEPAVRAAMAKAKMGVVGPSVDLDQFSARVVPHRDGQHFVDIAHGRISGATLVGIPAFDDTRLTVHDDDSPLGMTAAAWTMEDDDSAELSLEDIDMGEDSEFSVKTSWGLPMASPDMAWDAGKALAELDSWAGTDMTKYGSAFLWKDDSADASLKGSYKFPIAMPINGKLTIVPAAVRAAASRADSAGIPDADKIKLKAAVAKLMSKVHAATVASAAPLEGLIAGGGPLAPPKMAFEKPDLPADTILPWISPDGRFFTYVAPNDVCHTGFEDTCVLSPKTKTNYQRFHQGSVLTAEGEVIRTGKISLGGGHASPQLGLQAAVDHYDDVSTAVAVVRAGEDEYGVYVAGAILPGITDEKIAALRRSPLSGDWRYYAPANNLELVAALCVNTPGFPLTFVASGQQMSLCASYAMPVMPTSTTLSVDTVVTEEPVIDPDETDDIREARIGRLAAILSADQMHRDARLAALRKEA